MQNSMGDGFVHSMQKNFYDVTKFYLEVEIMDRENARQLLEWVREHSDPLAALALYERSIGLGHTKIAVLRYLNAKMLGAPMSDLHKIYAFGVAQGMRVRDLISISDQANLVTRFNKSRNFGSREVLAQFINEIVCRDSLK